MSGLLLLIPIALLMGLFGLACFFWAMRHGQFEDLDGAAQRVLIEDDDAGPARRDGPPDAVRHSKTQARRAAG